MPARPTKTDRAPKNRWSATDRTGPGRAFSHRDGRSSRTPASPTPRHFPTLDAASRSFADLGVPANLVAALGADGIGEPFPIQAATIPDALAGRDVLGRGRTGSGKTLAFGLPMISRLAASSGPARVQPRGLVLVPTRELAMQVADVLVPLARTAGLSLVLVAGGMPYPPQILAFSRGVDIVVATPGRLIDLMDREVADLSGIEITVLDEADHMADLGFLPAVSQVLDTVPNGGQRLLFSATLDNAIDHLVRTYLHEPVERQVDTGQASVPLMSHHLVSVAPQHKAAVTAEIASRPGRTLIFVRTQRGADRVAEQLRRSGVLAGALHGGLAQGARTRIMSAFKQGSLPVLVATDVAARGIHVDEVGLVLHADPPTGPKEYLHRAGRTARAGETGTVVAFALPHQRRELGRLTTQAGVRPMMLAAIPGDRALAAATGARRASGDAISDAAYQRVIAPPPARRSQSARGRRGGRGVRTPGPSGRRHSPASTGARSSRSRRVA
jgi:superfamily II DNA/RNA helicase